MIHEPAAGILAVEAGCGLERQRRAPIPPKFEQVRHFRQLVRQQNFLRLQSGQRSGEPVTAHFLGKEVAGCHVQPGEAGFSRRLGHSRQKVVPPGIQQRVLGQRARRHDANHLALDQCLAAPLFRLGGVFHLLADCDLEPRLDQARQVGLRRMHGNPAHGHVLAGLLAPFGQRDVEGARGGDGVVEEQLVEIAHAVENKTFRVVRLDLKIMHQHGRQRTGSRIRCVRVCRFVCLVHIGGR